MKAVLRLQQLALDPDTKVSVLLNNAYLISSKLGIKDFQDWCNNELNGYLSEEVPDYRLVRGEIKAYAVNKPIIPVVLYGAEIAQYADFKIIRDNVSKLDEWVYSDNEFISLKLDQVLEDYINQCINEDENKLINSLNMGNNPFVNNLRSGYRPFLCIHKSDISNILSRIRKIILDWSLDLDNKGILGEDYHFTEQEKQMTQNINYHIGNVGNMANHNDNSTINQTSTNNVNIVKGDFNSLASNLRSHGVEEADIQELQTIIDVTPLPQSSNEYSHNLKAWIAKMVTKSIDGTWQVAVDAAGSLLATGLQQYFGI
jgi:hypothetical protein